MLSNRPYLLRAFHEWISDSQCTPILVLDATHPKCKVPMEFVDNGEIVFNVSPSAVRDLKMGNELVEFKASFSGVVHIISAPMRAILAIYAEENGEGLFFDAEEDDNETSLVADKLSEEVIPLKSIEGGSPHVKDNISVKQSNNVKPFLKLVE